MIYSTHSTGAPSANILEMGLWSYIDLDSLGALTTLI